MAGQPRAWERLTESQRNSIRQAAAANADVRREFSPTKRVRTHDANGTAFTDPSGPREDNFVPPGPDNTRQLKRLVFKVGGLVKGEKITCEYEDDGTASIYVTGPSVNVVGKIPPGGEGDSFYGDLTGDEEPSGNERMLTHTLEYPERKDPLLVSMNKINGMTAERGNTVVGSAEMPKDRNVRPAVGDDLLKPVALGSQSPPSGTTPNLSPRPTSNQLKLPGNDTRDRRRNTYRDGSTAQQLQKINLMNKLRYGQ